MSRTTRLGNALLAAALRRRGVPVHDIARVRVARRSRLRALGAAQLRGLRCPARLGARLGAHRPGHGVDAALSPRAPQEGPGDHERNGA
ncbi:MAG TPA: hypothetical protein VHH34_13630 [Pseudonocardiaceae bacterium]|nr:hypothetical protein [Pseudonocardiaceae bacterium]